MPKQNSIDYTLIVAVSILITIGVIMVYSASSNIAASKFDDPKYFLEKHAIRLLIGLVMMTALSYVDYHIFRKFSLIGLFVSIGMLIYLLVMEAASIKGASRWLSVAGISFQPSVFAGYALIFYMADAIDRKQERLHEFFDGYFPLLIVMCVTILLILLEPDFSTTVIITIVIGIMFFIGNVRISHMFATAVAALPFFILAIVTAPYRLKRLVTFLNPDLDPLGSGYQIKQSLIGLGSGGLLGVGIGQSKQKLLYLPEPFTDFIYSIIGEELGFIGAFAVLFLFLIILWRGFLIARQAPELYGKLLASGITLCIVVTAFINIGVVSGALPTTGIPMPFISYGGSSLTFTLMAVGVLLNISRHNTKKPLKNQRN